MNPAEDLARFQVVRQNLQKPDLSALHVAVQLSYIDRVVSLVEFYNCSAAICRSRRLQVIVVMKKIIHIDISE